MSVPPFSTTTPRYDMDTFTGRLKHWMHAINPMFLLETETSLRRSQAMLNAYQQHQKPFAVEKASAPPTDAELWHARMAVENCVHPTTNDIINPFFRMCMFLPMNFLIVPMMMAPFTLASFPATAAVQWFNQSYNSAVNYCNRSSDKQPVSELLKAYAGTVVVAVGGNLAGAAWLKRLPAGTLQATIIRATMPFAAVVGAGAANLALMRRNEWMSSGKGIALKDEDGVVRGNSVVAGRDSLWKCCMARVLWNIPCMVLPTVCAVPLRRYVPLARRNPYLTEVMLQVVGLTAGVPPALAYYNLTQTLPATAFEAKFQNLKRKNGEPVKQLTYYKGL